MPAQIPINIAYIAAFFVAFLSCDFASARPPQSGESQEINRLKQAAEDLRGILEAEMAVLKDERLKPRISLEERQKILSSNRNAIEKAVNLLRCASGKRKKLKCLVGFLSFDTANELSTKITISDLPFEINDSVIRWTATYALLQAADENPEGDKITGEEYLVDLLDRAINGSKKSDELEEVATTQLALGVAFSEKHSLSDSSKKSIVLKKLINVIRNDKAPELTRYAAVVAVHHTLYKLSKKQIAEDYFWAIPQALIKLGRIEPNRKISDEYREIFSIPSQAPRGTTYVQRLELSGLQTPLVARNKIFSKLGINESFVLKIRELHKRLEGKKESERKQICTPVRGVGNYLDAAYSYGGERIAKNVLLHEYYSSGRSILFDAILREDLKDAKRIAILRILCSGVINSSSHDDNGIRADLKKLLEVYKLRGGGVKAVAATAILETRRKLSGLITQEDKLLDEKIITAFSQHPSSTESNLDAENRGDCYAFVNGDKKPEPRGINAASKYSDLFSPPNFWVQRLQQAVVVISSLLGVAIVISGAWTFCIFVMEPGSIKTIADRQLIRKGDSDNEEIKKEHFYGVLRLIFCRKITPRSSTVQRAWINQEFQAAEDVVADFQKKIKQSGHLGFVEPGCYQPIPVVVNSKRIKSTSSSVITKLCSDGWTKIVGEYGTGKSGLTIHIAKALLQQKDQLGVSSIGVIPIVLNIEIAAAAIKEATDFLNAIRVEINDLFQTDRFNTEFIWQLLKTGAAAVIIDDGGLISHERKQAALEHCKALKVKTVIASFDNRTEEPNGKFKSIFTVRMQEDEAHDFLKGYFRHSTSDGQESLKDFPRIYEGESIPVWCVAKHAQHWSSKNTQIDPEKFWLGFFTFLFSKPIGETDEDAISIDRLQQAFEVISSEWFKIGYVPIEANKINEWLPNCGKELAMLEKMGVIKKNSGMLELAYRILGDFFVARMVEREPQVLLENADSLEEIPTHSRVLSFVSEVAESQG